jgi:hypothetical protein
MIGALRLEEESVSRVTLAPFDAPDWSPRMIFPADEHSCKKNQLDFLLVLVIGKRITYCKEENTDQQGRKRPHSDLLYAQAVVSCQLNEGVL